MKSVFFLLISLIIFSCNAFTETLKERFLNADEGTYIAFENQNMVSCLIFRSIENNRLFLHEISMPSSKFTSDFNLKDWLLSNPTDSSSSVIYSINLKNNQVEDCFSFTRRSYINLSEQGSFLPKLLDLDLKSVIDSKRKKLCSRAGDIRENQRFWNPPKIVNGKKIKQRNFKVFETNWPVDESELSNKPITLYFDMQNESFPFPYWIEVGIGPVAHKLRAKDSGKLETLPFDFFPQKPIEVVSFNKTKDLSISLINATYFDKFQIMASSYHNEMHFTHLLDHQITQKDGVTILHVCEEHLQETLQKDLSYHICIFPDKDPSQVIEIKETLKN